MKNRYFTKLPFKMVVRTILKALYGNILDRVLHGSKYKKLQAFKDIHKGERLFVIATGPSLTLEDVDMLKDEQTFSMNSCYKMFDKTEWRPSYYAIFDNRVFQLLHDELQKQSLSCAFCPSLNFDWNKEFVHKIPIEWDWKFLFQEYDTFVKHGFSNDISKKVCTGSNVVYVIFQIAFYMGFSEIYILGADCTMGTHSKIAAYQGGEDKKEQALIPNGHIIADYKIIKEEADKRGVKVYNATRGGALEVFERVALEDVIKK